MLSLLRSFFVLRGRAPDAGQQGEDRAAVWLQRERGFRIIVRNWRSPKDRRDELDLVGDDGGVVVFVEVKARAAGALVPGYHAIDARKRRVLRRAIRAYLRHLVIKPRTFRFDVVEVTSGPAGGDVLHFENVPLFSKHFHV